jgi:hypothetical protein
MSLADEIAAAANSTEPEAPTSLKDQIANAAGGNVEPEQPSSILGEYGKKLASGLSRGAQLITRGAVQTMPGAVLGGEIGGVPGALIGGAVIPFGDTLNSIINRVTGSHLQMPSQIVSRGLSKMGLAEPQTEGERIAEAAGSGLGGAGGELAAMYRLAGSGSQAARELAQQFIQSGGRQLAVAPTAAAGGQAVAEETDSPFAGLLASLGIGAAGGLSMNRKAVGVPSHEDLVLESKNLYDKAKSSGVQFDPNEFSNKMTDIGKQLRQEGYTATAYPGLSGVLDEASNTQMPKDFTELQAIRKMIQGQQKSTDPETRRLASILKDDFDDYVLNAPSSHITTGSAQGTKDWADARNSYSRLKKSEIFDDMLTNAQLDQSKFTQSGAENSMAQQLRQLAKNDKKMRTFTPDEQDAIREAAKGGNVQNLMKFYGRFAPTGPVSGIFGVGASAYEPTIGVPFTLGAMGARKVAESIRANDVQNLAARMRQGAAPQMTSRTQNVPMTSLQSLIGAPAQNNQNYLRDLIENINPMTMGSQ